MFGDIFAQFRLHGQGGPFVETFRCLSLTFHDKVDKESGDKIILPVSAMQKLANMNVQYPMQFELRNENVEPLRRTHVGVLEFTAPEGQMFVPYWIMQNLLLEENALLTVRNVSLQLATFVKFRPQSVDFLEISNHKAVLETALRNFSCFTKGDVICLPYGGKNYHIEIVDLLPRTPDDAVSIVEADVRVEFEAPVGYVEPDYKAAAAAVKAESASPPSAASPPVSSTATASTTTTTNSMQELARARELRRKELDAKNAAYVPFSGTGRRIDDKKTSTTTTTDAAATSSSTAASRTGGKWKQRTTGSAFLGEGKKLEE